jgi:hypothetical protein
VGNGHDTTREATTIMKERLMCKDVLVQFLDVDLIIDENLILKSFHQTL